MAQVYKVWNAVQRRVEALSVMDREHITGDEEVVRCALYLSSWKPLIRRV